MNVISRISGATAILLILAGCAVQSQPVVTMPKLPGCEETHARLPYPNVSSDTGNQIPNLASTPMRLCRYRWDDPQNKLTLIAEVNLPSAPASLLQALGQLKTVYQVYGPNAGFFCPLMRGNIDLIIFQTASMSDLTVVGVQRDGCAQAGVTNDNFATYVAYLGSKALSAQLDAIKVTA